MWWNVKLKKQLNSWGKDSVGILFEFSIDFFSSECSTLVEHSSDIIDNRDTCKQKCTLEYLVRACAVENWFRLLTIIWEKKIIEVKFSSHSKSTWNIIKTHSKKLTTFFSTHQSFNTINFPNICFSSKMMPPMFYNFEAHQRHHPLTLPSNKTHTSISILLCLWNLLKTCSHKPYLWYRPQNHSQICTILWIHELYKSLKWVLRFEIVQQTFEFISGKDLCRCSQVKEPSDSNGCSERQIKNCKSSTLEK